MPGAERFRNEFEQEGLLREEKRDFELIELPSGDFKRIPREICRVESVNGVLIKSKAVLHSSNFGCGHSRLTPDQEASLTRQTGLRSGYCHVCERESCPSCLGRQCESCDKFHNTCEECGRTCCRRCLTIEHKRSGKRKCRATCTTCARQRHAPRAENLLLPKTDSAGKQGKQQQKKKKKKKRRVTPAVHSASSSPAANYAYASSGSTRSSASDDDWLFMALAFLGGVIALFMFLARMQR